MSDQTSTDPFLPDEVPEDEATLPLDMVIQTGINAALLETHTWLPCQVTRLYPDGFVDVQTLLKRTYTDGTIKPLPVCQHIMVAHISGQTWAFKGPVAVGDVGRAVFCERSLDKWSVQGGQVDPDDDRHHDLSDAVYEPGLPNSATQISGKSTDLIVRNGSAQITLSPDGKVKIGNGTDELVDLFDQLMTALNQALVITGIGPQQFLTSTLQVFSQIQAKIDALKGS